MRQAVLGGIKAPPREYFVKLRELCDEYGILLVFDEIVTGFGRTGNYFAFQGIGIKPDIFCIGKGVSGGYAPLSATVLAKHVAQRLRHEDSPPSFAPSHTYAGNPISASAGIAACDILCQVGKLDSIRNKGTYLRGLLRERLKDVAEIRGEGMLFGIAIRDAVVSNAGILIQTELLKRNFIVRGQDNWIVLAPPFVLSYSELDYIAETVCKVIERVLSNRLVMQ